MGLDGGHMCVAQSTVGIASVYGASVLRSRAHVLLQDFHSDNNHPALDTSLADQMVFCVLYRLITCNISQGIKSIDGGL